jgi:hypothetical protein
MTILYRAAYALLARGCTVRQVLSCSIPAEQIADKDVAFLVGLIAPHLNSRALRNAVEHAAEDLSKTPLRRGVTAKCVDEVPAGRRRAESR